MKIAIDISQVVYGTGVSVYTKELVRALLSVDKENIYVLYAGVLKRREDFENYVKTLKGNFSVVTLPLPPKISDILWNYFRPFPIETLIGKVDLFHSSDWTEPSTNCSKVTTVHDLSPILYPQATHPRIKRVFGKKMSLVKRDSSLIIVPSLSIQMELVKYGINSSRIFHIPEAPNPELLRESNVDIKRRFNIKGEYVLVVGTAERKNISRAYEAFRLAKFKDTVLVVTGEHRSGLPVGEDIIYLGFVDTHELSGLYKNARLFLYPSLYEGFGLPILEAFSLGCPVVTSNLGSMQEIAGSGASLVNPYDTKDIKRGILDVLKNSKAYVKRGKEIVKGYSWEETARQTLNVYKKAYEGK